MTYLGARQDDKRIAWRCHYSSAPSTPMCLAEAFWHGIVTSVAGRPYAAGLPCCNQHLPQMRLTAEHVHELKHPCCLPDARFVEVANLCRLDWDETSLLVGASQAVST